MDIRTDRKVAWALWALVAPDVRLGHRELAAMEAAEECEPGGPCPASGPGDELRVRAELMRGDARRPGFCQQAAGMPGLAIAGAARGRRGWATT